MNVAVSIKRYRATKDIGKIKMSVGVIAYYQLMQVCQVKMLTVSFLFFLVYTY